MHDDVDLLAVARHGLIDRIVDDFFNQMVKPSVARIADVHGRTSSDGLQALENLNRAGVVR